MKWKVAPVSGKPPSIGNKKIVQHFAWLPTRCQNDIKVWLEPYYQEYEYIEYLTGYGPHDGMDTKWEPQGLPVTEFVYQISKGL